MPNNYLYIGKKINGETVKGKLLANSQKDAMEGLRRQNIFPTKITKENAGNKELTFTMFQKISTKDLAVFCRQFFAILEAGISVLDCLEILRRQTENKKFRDSINDVYEEVQKGQNLSTAMAKYKKIYPEILVNMVETGEVSGQLDIVMDRMASHFEKEDKIKKKIQNSMIYPAVIGAVSIIVIWFLITFVLPNFISMFSGFGVMLPLPTRILLGLGNWMNRFWYVPPATVIILFYTFSKYKNTDLGRKKVDRLLLSLPIVGKVNRKIATSRFSRTLATLISSGISIIEAMEIVMKIIGNAVVSEGISKSMDSIKKGMGVADPLDELDIFPPMLISMIKVGEESGSLDAMLSKTADFYDNEVENAVTQMTALIEPLVIVILAIVVGFIVVSVVLPMFEMFNQVGV